MSSSAKPFKGQRYCRLKRQCQRRGQLFSDPWFPPDDSSLYASGDPGKRSGVVQWKRPKDICQNPRLIVSGATAGDVVQGRLGNCWLVAATTCIANHKSTWKKIIPNADDQEWEPKNPDKYCGIFCFRFWHHGEWVDVTIDDQLPTINGRLIYMHSKKDNEFWCALLEKAYAKVFGCYEALNGGGLEEALVDFTGGIAESINLGNGEYSTEAKQRELFDMLFEEMKNKSLMAAAVPATSAKDMEAMTPQGLVKGHAYSITDVKFVALAGSGFFSLFRKEHISLLKLRNPWGRFEWKGAFSGDSAEWNKVSKSDRRKLGVDDEDDGEFWMPFDDFCKHFLHLTICRMINTSWLSLSKSYTEAVFEDEWTKPLRAGGCSNNQNRYLHNPQFVFSITKPEDSALISLEQYVEDRCLAKPTIGFHIIAVEENRISRLHERQNIVNSSTFRNSRSVFGRFKLAQGRYVALPCTFEPGVERRFMLRLYTSRPMNSRAMTEDYPSKRVCCGLCIRPFVLATRVKFISASGLPASASSAKLYLVVTCEGQEVKVPACSANSQCWTWNRSVIFYRSDIRSVIAVQVFDENSIPDKFMGQFAVASSAECQPTMSTFPLTLKKRGDKQVSGSVVAVVTSRRELDTF